MPPLLMLALAAAPVVGPAVSPGTVVTAPAGSEARRLRAASDGTHTVVVYLDQREADPTVWAARLDAAQALTDPHDFRLDGAWAATPDVAYFGGATPSFVFAWERNGGLFLRRLDPAGGFRDATPKILIPSPAFNPAIAADATSGYLVWTDTTQDPKTLRFARFDATGAINSTPLTLVTGAVASPRLCLAGTALLVTWSTGMSVQGLRLQPNGTLIDAAPVTLATTTGTDLVAEIAASPNGWFVTFGEQSATAELRGQLVPRMGAIPAPFAIATHAGASSAAWDETNNRGVVFWNGVQDGRLSATRVTPAAVVDAMPTVLRSGGTGELVATVSSGLGVQLFWNEVQLGGPDTDLFESRISPALVALDAPGVNVVQTGSFQDEPRLATDGTGYLLVWQEYRAVTGWDVWAAAVSATGVLGAAVPLQAANGAQLYPRVAFAGGVYLVGWVDDSASEAKFARVSAAGQLLDATPFALPGGGGSRPAIGGSGATFLVAYTAGGVKARRYQPGTGWLDPVAPILLSPSDALVNDVEGSGGGDWAVAYMHGDLGPLHLFLNRVTAAGVVRDGQGVQVTLPSSNPYEPTVAWDGTQYLAAWHDHRPPGTPGYLFGAHVDPGTGVREPTGFQIGPSDAAEQQVQALARLGGGLGALYWSSDLNTIKWQAVFGNTVSPATTIVASPSIASAPNDLATTPTSMLWATVQMRNGDRRVVVHPVALAQVGAVCVDPWDCHSGRCVAFTCVPAVVADAGMSMADAGVPDAGISDAGVVATDGGSVVAGPRRFGIGCSQAGGAPLVLLFMLLLFRGRSRSGCD